MLTFGLHGFWMYVVVLTLFSIGITVIGLLLFQSWSNGKLPFLVVIYSLIVLALGTQSHVRQINLQALQELGGGRYFSLIMVNLILWAIGMSVIFFIRSTFIIWLAKRNGQRTTGW
jgi:hypothetical protein